MDREEKRKRTSHITDPILKESMLRILDLAWKVQVSYESKVTEFLTPYEQKQALSILEGFDGVGFALQGGIASSERKILYLYPDYEEDCSRGLLSCLKISGNFHFRKVNHRDYLGSILSLGIRRETLGDIFVAEDCAYVVCLKSMEDYIFLGLDKVANVGVNVQVVDWGEVPALSPKAKEKIFVVSSLRLDSVVAGMFHLSRTEAQKLIGAERVQVDYQFCTQASKQMEPPLVISVRGYGKGKFEEVVSQTRKDKWRVKTLIYEK